MVRTYVNLFLQKFWVCGNFFGRLPLVNVWRMKNLWQFHKIFNFVFLLFFIIQEKIWKSKIYIVFSQMWSRFPLSNTNAMLSVEFCCSTYHTCLIVLIKNQLILFQYHLKNYSCKSIFHYLTFNKCASTGLICGEWF